MALESFLAADSMTATSPTHCPLCGQPNRCGLAEGSSQCWCFDIDIDPAVLEAIPDEAKGEVCICEACARGERGDLVPSIRGVR